MQSEGRMTVRRTNVGALLRMVRQYLNGETQRSDFVLDFPYEMEKRYRKAAEEDEEYTEMMYYYLIECGTDRGEGLSDEEFRQLMRKQYDEVMDGVY